MPRSTDVRSKVVLLGTGTPNPDALRFGPAIAVVVAGTPFLFDAGAGVVQRAAAAREQGVEELDVRRLTRVFITHLHSDHTVGLANLLLSPWVLGRSDPITLHGPPGLRSMTDHLLAAYQEDIRVRGDGLEPICCSAPRALAIEIEPGRIFDDGTTSVDAFPVHHGPWTAFGYRITAPDRVVVISGDTAPFPGMHDAYATCDLLIHEVHSERGWASRDPAWKTYHRSMHTSATELARIAAAVNPGLLVLTHPLDHGVVTEEELVAEICSLYSGPVICGHDLEVF